MAEKRRGTRKGERSEKRGTTPTARGEVLAFDGSFALFVAPIPGQLILAPFGLFEMGRDPLCGSEPPVWLGAAAAHDVGGVIGKSSTCI